MKRLLLLILAMFVVAAPAPVLATQTMCAQTMPMMASMDHGMQKGPCCDEKHKACMIACDGACTAALIVAPETTAYRATPGPVALSGPVTTFAIANVPQGLDRPPRTSA